MLRRLKRFTGNEAVGCVESSRRTGAVVRLEDSTHPTASQNPGAKALRAAFLAGRRHPPGGLMAVGVPGCVIAARSVGRMGAMLAAVAASGSVQIADQSRIALIILGFVVVIIADVAGLFGPFPFFLVGLEHGRLDDFTASGV